MILQEWIRLKAVIDSPRDLAIFTLAYWRGLRATEIGMLAMDNLQLSTWRLRVERVKGSYGGEYLLSPEEQSALKAWLRVRGKKPGPLFPGRNGHWLNRRTLWVLIQHYGQLAELPPDKRHPHVLKHSIATHLLELGADIMEVKDWLGHR